MFKSKGYPAHRLAWFYVHGTWPKKLIDHINGDCDDNRIANLREADHQMNAQNQRKAKKNNKLGILGVHFCDGKYTAEIWVKGRPLRLGRFLSADEAHNAYVEAKRRLHAGCTL